MIFRVSTETMGARRQRCIIMHYYAGFRTESGRTMVRNGLTTCRNRFATCQGASIMHAPNPCLIVSIVLVDLAFRISSAALPRLTPWAIIMPPLRAARRRKPKLSAPGFAKRRRPRGKLRRSEITIAHSVSYGYQTSCHLPILYHMKTLMSNNCTTEHKYTRHHKFTRYAKSRFPVRPPHSRTRLFSAELFFKVFWVFRF